MDFTLSINLSLLKLFRKTGSLKVFGNYVKVRDVLKYFIDLDYIRMTHCMKELCLVKELLFGYRN